LGAGLDFLLVLLPLLLVLTAMIGTGLGWVIVMLVGVPGFLLVDSLAWFAADGNGS
jgi:hypothetical protein